MMLFRKNDAQLDFDLAKVIEQLATRIDAPAATATQIDGSERSTNSAERLRTDVIQPAIATTIKKSIPRPTGLMGKPRIDATT